MIYKYTIDANEDWEEWYAHIFSTELLSKEEFEEVVKKAMKACGDVWNSYTDVAKKIIEMDNRFFVPEEAHTAIIQFNDNNSFGGIY